MIQRPNPDPRKLLNLTEVINESVQNGTFISAALTTPLKTSPYRRVDIRPILLKGTLHYQFSIHEGDKVIHRNFNSLEASQHLEELFQEHFGRLRITNSTEETDVQNVHGRLKIHSTVKQNQKPDLQHNRSVKYIIPEGIPCSYLYKLGVMTQDGQVIASKRAKYRQINRFLEIVSDIVNELPTGKPINIVDFGCGKSYLTFSLYYYLTTILGLSVSLTGIDQKQDVITQCSKIADEQGMSGLNFIAGDIAEKSSIGNIDLAISLHACDTATDMALAQSVRGNAKVILAVPCCQHELNKQLKAPPLQSMLEFGLMRDRLTELVTDTLRAKLLETEGYSTQMLEFIDAEHTPRNILIRAVNRGTVNRINALSEYETMRDFWNVSPTLERELNSIESN